MPVYVDAVLLPFEGRITYDGLLGGFPLLFGAGARRAVAGNLERIQERGEVCHSLEPGKALPAVDKVKAARKANTSVLRAYATYLRAQRHSDATCARDLAVAEWLAESVEPDRSLAVLRGANIERLVGDGGRGPCPRAEILTSLERFLVFLAQTSRMGGQEVDDVHRWLRALGRRR